MISFSVKLSRGKILAGMGGMLLLTVLIVLFCGAKKDRLVSSNGKIVIKGYTASNNEDRKSFFQQFGWEVSEEPVAVSEVVIPENFDQAMEEYNAVQKKQGLDLSKYRGKRAWLYTYRVDNYPDRDDVLASILLVGDQLVGGDITATGENGFIHGFALES